MWSLLPQKYWWVSFLVYQFYFKIVLFMKILLLYMINNIFNYVNIL